MARDGWMLLVISAGAFALRVWPALDRIFINGFVNFQGDAWYHMRVVDNLISNYPHRLTLDPYAAAGGQYVGVAPLFDLFVATIALTVGLGSPSPALVEAVGAFVPPALGTLAVVLVYALGRRLFDSRTGLLAAALLAGMPGHFLDRSVLGVTDHHVAEVVLVQLTLLLMVMTLQAPSPRTRTARVVPWLAGVSLGAYFLTWTSAPLFATGLALWLVVHYLIEQLRGGSIAPLARLVATVAVTALALVLVFQDPAMFRYQLQLVALGGLLGLAALFQGIDLLVARGRLSRVGAVAVPVVMAVAAITVIAVIYPSFAGEVRVDLARLRPANGDRSVLETQSLLFLYNRFSLAHPWDVFGPAFYLAVPALAALALRATQQRDPAKMLLLVWSGAMFAATLGQNRFGYYLAPILAVLAGWSASSLFTWARRDPATARSRSDFVAVAVAVVIFYPTLRPGVASIQRQEGMPAPWREALTWMRLNTPEPFADPSFYTARYDRESLPEASYSVMAWWDYGYWITRMAHRVPVANPTQHAAAIAAQFLTATDEADAMSILAANGSRYVIVDQDLVLRPTGDRATLQGKFEGIAAWAGHSARRFMEPMIRRLPDGGTAPVWVFYQDYYRAMATRLQALGTADIEPANGTWVITYADRRTRQGSTIRELTGARSFGSYASAEAHLKSLGTGPHRIAGLDPFKSPIPLPRLVRFQLVHEAGRTVTGAAVRIYSAPAVAD
jgi:dolichyl-diphosphooligosaccharide--protein glycosyltransferase